MVDKMMLEPGTKIKVVDDLTMDYGLFLDQVGIITFRGMKQDGGRRYRVKFNCGSELLVSSRDLEVVNE